jgi:hypothetical protein
MGGDSEKWMERIGRDKDEKNCQGGKSSGGAKEVSKGEGDIWRWKGKSENRPNFNKTLWLIRLDIKN